MGYSSLGGRTNLLYACLDEADISDAILIGADLTNASMKHVKTSAGTRTRWPGNE
jgi:uncharacterized protein YjbI with pentapeptide repeats